VFLVCVLGCGCDVFVHQEGKGLRCLGVYVLHSKHWPVGGLCESAKSWSETQLSC